MGGARRIRGFESKGIGTFGKFDERVSALEAPFAGGIEASVSRGAMGGSTDGTDRREFV